MTTTLLKLTALGLCLSLAGCDKDKKQDDPAATSSAPAKEAQAVAKTASKTLTSRAIEHLPAGCIASGHFDFKAMMKDKVVKAHLVDPIQKELTSLLSAPSAEEKDAAEALTSLGVKNISQFHSVAFCATGYDFEHHKQKGFVVVVAGELAANSNVLELLAKASKPGKEKLTLVKVGGINALKGVEDTLITQAPDGSFIITDDEKLLASATKISKAYEKYGLDLSKNISISITAETAAQALAQNGKRSPFATLKPGASQLSGSVDGTFDAKIELASEKAAKDAVALLTSLMAQMKNAPDPMTAQILSGVKLAADKSNLHISVALPPTVVETGVKNFGVSLQKNIARTKAEPKNQPQK